MVADIALLVIGSALGILATRLAASKSQKEKKDRVSAICGDVLGHCVRAAESVVEAVRKCEAHESENVDYDGRLQEYLVQLSGVMQEASILKPQELRMDLGRCHEALRAALNDATWFGRERYHYSDEEPCASDEREALSKLATAIQLARSVRAQLSGPDL